MVGKSDSIWRRRRFEITLVLAAACHLALLSHVPAEWSLTAPQQALLEIDLLPLAEATIAPPEPPASVVGPGDAAISTTAAAQVRPFAPSSTLGDTPIEAIGPEDDLSTDSAPRVSEPRSARKGVRLFLGQSDLAELTRNAAPRPRAAAAPAAPPPSVGLLTEGLHELDADKGLSASSPAVSASYRAARLGPSVGTAVFEIRTDTRGSVTTVRVIGDDAKGAWSSVAADLLARLKDRLLRLPAGAKGLVTRLRIDRGELAQDLSDRGKTKRGVALGQDHHPKDFGWDESTQGASRPNRLSPTLGVSSDDLRTSIKTRVQLLSQQSL